MKPIRVPLIVTAAIFVLMVVAIPIVSNVFPNPDIRGRLILMFLAIALVGSIAYTGFRIRRHQKEIAREQAGH